MSHGPRVRGPGWLLLALAGAVLLGGLPAQPARAAGFDKPASSLALIPATSASPAFPASGGETVVDVDQNGNIIVFPGGMAINMGPAQRG